MSLLSQDGLDRLVAEARRAPAAPGASVAVVAGDRTLLAADGVQDVATGAPVSTDTVFEIRSVSKLFTAALAMMLHDQGLVGLDDPVAAVLAQGGHGLQAAHGAISLAHLLSHSSGLEADYLADAKDANAVAAFVERSSALPLLFAAGRTYSYSNIGTVWATAVLGAAGGAVAASAIFGLNDKRFADAICLASAVAAGFFQLEESWVKNWNGGWAANAGISAAVTARVGYNGPLHALEGPMGFFAIHTSVRHIDPSTLSPKGAWRSEAIALKRYSCCHFLQSTIDCARRIAAPR